VCGAWHPPFMEGPTWVVPALLQDSVQEALASLVSKQMPRGCTGVAVILTGVQGAVIYLEDPGPSLPASALWWNRVSWSR